MTILPMRNAHIRYFTTHRHQKFLIVRVSYFTNQIEAHVLSMITVKRVRPFYCQQIIRKCCLPRFIISDNGTQFPILTMVDLCQNLQTKFILVVHLQANGKVESLNKVILGGIKKKISDAKGLWAKQIHEVLWSYHTTHHSTIKEPRL